MRCNPCWKTITKIKKKCSEKGVAFGKEFNTDARNGCREQSCERTVWLPPRLCTRRWTLSRQAGFRYWEDNQRDLNTEEDGEAFVYLQIIFRSFLGHGELKEGATLLWGCSHIRVVRLQGGLYSGWPLVREVCHQSGLLSGWSLIRVVSCQSRLWSGWSLE